MRFHWLFIVLLFGHIALGEQLDLPQVMRFRNHNNGSGLPGETVRTIYQDSKGLIWLGVEYKGLVSFDGIEFEDFSKDGSNRNSLSSNVVQCITEDSNSNLWIGTDDGLNRKRNTIDKYSSSNFARYYSSNDPFSIPDNQITLLFSSARQDLIVGTKRGLCIYLGTDRFKQISLNEGDEPEIQSILELDAGNLLVGTNKGFYFISNDYSHTRPFLKGAFEANAITDLHTMCPDGFGKVWIGTDRGLFAWDPNEEIIHPINQMLNQPFNSVGIDHLFRDRTGRMWVGSISNGLNIFYPEDDKYSIITASELSKSGFDAYQVRDIIEDSQGLIWIATKNKGFYTHDSRLQTFGFLGVNSGDIQLSENNVCSIYQARNKDLYIGTRQGGLNIIDHQSKRVTLYLADGKEGLNANRIESIVEDSSGTIWIGTILGLSKFGPGNKVFENFRLSPVRHLHIDSRNNLWVGTSQGVYLFDQQSSQFTNWSPKGFELPLKDNITTMMEDSKGNIWFGTLESGMIKYMVRQDSIIHFHRNNKTPLQGVSSNQVRSIYEDARGRIWLGTRLSGLFVQDGPHRPFIPASDDLKTTSVFAIQEGPDDIFWLSTNNGIYKYESQNKDLENYGVGYGAQGDVFTSSATFKTADGVIFFGGNNGLNFFEPEKVKKQYYVPQIHFKSIDTYGNGLKQLREKQFVFDYGSHISFEFFLSDYTSPFKNNYEYKFEGFNKEWINLGSRNHVAFANMEPGDYDILVRGSNSDGIYCENMAEVKFTILDPWWSTGLARTIYFVIVLVILYVIYRMLIFRAGKQHELQVLQLEKDQAEELTRHKLRFFTNISHELRTPLTVMLPSAEKVSEYEKDRDIATKGKTLLRNIRTIMDLIEELLEFRKIEQGHTRLNLQNTRLVGQCRSVYEEFVPVADKREIQYLFHATKCDYTILIDVKILDKVIRNLLSNAFKYTDYDDKIELSIALNDRGQHRKSHSNEDGHCKDLVISVKDTGVGIPEEVLPHIFDRFYRNENQSHLLKGAGIGLELVKSLVTLHQGNIEVESREGEGTKFTVRIPVEIIEAIDDQHEHLDEMTGQISVIPDKQYIDDVSGIKLLVVEDDNEIQDLLVDVFSSKYHVLLASNGKEGLKLAHQVPQPNIIISDIMMPEMDGLELCEKLKSNFKTSHIPVILLTAKSTPKDQLSGIENGADDYITKPFYTKLLVSKVENILKRQSRLRSYFEKESQIQPQDPPAYNKEKELLTRCTTIIKRNIDNQKFGVEELSREMGMSRTHLFRKLKYLIDQSPLELIYSIRMKAAMKLLESGNFSVSEVGYKTGFSSPSSFSITFKKYYGRTPKQFVPKSHGNKG